MRRFVFVRVARELPAEVEGGGLTRWRGLRVGGSYVIARHGVPWWNVLSYGEVLWVYPRGAFRRAGTGASVFWRPVLGPAFSYARTCDVPCELAILFECFVIASRKRPQFIPAKGLKGCLLR